MSLKNDKPFHENKITINNKVKEETKYKVKCNKVKNYQEDKPFHENKINNKVKES
jgi:hypothetical protein